MWRLTPLPDRVTPAALWAEDGTLDDTLTSVHPFAGWTGPVRATLEEATPGTARYEYFAVAGPGGGPRLQVGVFQYGTSPVLDTFPIEQSFTGGLTIATGDLTGDGIPDIVLGTGAGGGPRVMVLDGAAALSGRLDVLADFFAYASDFRGGVNVAVLGGQILTTPGVGGAPNVRTFDAGGDLLGSWFGGDSASRGGAQLAAGDYYLNDRPAVGVLSGGLIRTYTPTGTPEGATVGVPDATSIAVGYEGQELVPHLEVTTRGNSLLELDVSPIFAANGGRVVSLTSIDPGVINGGAPSLAPGAGSVGTVHQLDGLARFALTGGILSDTTYSTLNSSTVLGLPQTSPVGGSAIGEPDGGTGTLTGYVQGADGTWYGLTNRHVVSSDPGGQTFTGKEVYQPGPAFTGGQPFGAVAGYTPVGTPTNDSALIRLANPGAVNPLYGYTNAGDDGTLRTIQTTRQTATVKPGDVVYAFGFWGVSEGLVIATNQTVQVDDAGRLLTYTGQTVVASADQATPWIIPGYSGSLVTDAQGDWVGQAFAGSLTVGIFSPITTVLSSLGVSP